MDEDILGIIAGFLLLFVPVAGITLRFAFKPFADSIAKIIEARASATEADVARRLDVLEHEFLALRGDVRQVLEARKFRERLSDPDS